MTRHLDGDRSGANAGVDDKRGEEAWTPAEHALLDAALAFYGAAEGVIDYAGRRRPQVRQDAAGFDAVRRAMAELEDCVRSARAAGVTPERIAQVARIDEEMVSLILQREPAAPSPTEG